MMGRGTGTGPADFLEDEAFTKYVKHCADVAAKQRQQFFDSLYPPPDRGFTFSGAALDEASPQELETKRKAEGRCLHCGELLPMSAMGLGDCKVCL